MKTIVNIPDVELADAMRFTGARTKSEAIFAAITGFNRRERMKELLRHAGTCDALVTAEELQAQRRQA